MIAAMAAESCYHCGHALVGEQLGPWRACGNCQRFVHVPSQRSLVAIARLLRQIESELEVGEAQRRELWQLLTRQRGEVLAAAKALGGPVLPPPLPQPQAVAASQAVEPPAAAATPPPPPPLPTSGPPLLEVRFDEPSLWSRLGPLFAENLLFALAGFLLVAGAVYFTTTAWTTMSGAMQKLVVAGGLLLFAGLLHGAATVLGRDAALRVAARALSLVAVALAPSASVAASLLYGENVLLALLVGATAAGAQVVFLRALVRREGQTLPGAVAAVTSLLVFGGVFAVPWAPFRVVASCAVAAAAPALVWWSWRRSALSVDLCALAGAAFAALALAIGMALAAGTSPGAAAAPVGVVVAGLALAAMVLAAGAQAPSPVAVTVAYAAGISAVLLAAGDVRCVMVAAWAAAATGFLASLRLVRARLLGPAIVLSAVGYLFLPAPVRELAARLREQAAGQLGYTPQRLPLSFYGITFLPWLAGLALLTAWFRRTGRNAHRQVASVFAVAAALGLAAMSLLLGSDLRAPMAVLPADGLLLVLVGHLARSWRAAIVGWLGVLGGVVCGLVWFEVPNGVATVVLATAVAALLAGRSAADASLGPVAASRRAVGGAAAVALAVWPLLCVWPLETQPVWNLLHATALLPLGIAWYRFARTPGSANWQTSAVAWLVAPSSWGTATGVATLLADVGFAPAWLAMPAALAVVTAPLIAGVARLRSLPGGESAARHLALGLFALHALLWPALIARYEVDAVAWSTIAGTTALAVVAGWLAAAARFDALLAVAVVESAWPLHLLAIVVFGSAAGPPGLLGPSVLVVAVAWFGHGRPALHRTAATGAVLFLLLLASWRLVAFPAQPPPRDAALTLGIGFAFGALAAWRLGPRPGGFEETAWRAAGVLAAVVCPVSLLDLLVTGTNGYAWGALVLGALVCAAAARLPRLALPLSVYGLLHLGVSLALWFSWHREAEDANLQRLAGFVAVGIAAVWCRPRELRTPSTLVALAAGFGAGVVQPVALQWWSSEWATVPALGGCALALAATGLPRLRARAFAVRLVAWPAVVAATVMLAAVFAVEVGHVRGPDDLELLDANAAVLGLAALGLAVQVGEPLRVWLRWSVATVVLAATAPVNGLLHASRAVAPSPDVEIALLALALCALAREHALAAVAAFGVAALLLTGFDLADVSTPFTVTLVAGVPLALLLRRLPGPFVLVHGALLLLATWSWIAYALVGRDAARLGPWLGLSAAMLGAAASPWLRFLTRDRAARAELSALQAACWLAALGALHAACGGAPMGALALIASLVASALVAGCSARGARTAGHEVLVHVALVALVTGYRVLAVGSELLLPLQGLHHHGLTVLGATLFVVAGSRASAMGVQLRAAAVVAPLLAIALAVPFGGLTFALLGGSAVLALGAAVARMRLLAALSLMLANAGLFRLWLREGVFDPSFYGVPAGLSLVFGAELARGPLGAPRVMVLRVAGLVVAYGSVLVQIARVSVPAHAVLLFVLAMLAVAWGARRRQAAILVTGVVAVVLDVVVYLAQRGFQQDFTGSVLLVGAGGSVFVVAARAARARARIGERPPAG